MPGFGASDRSTVVIRRYLDSLGYQALPWTLGTNLGPAMPELPERLAARLEEAYRANREHPVSIVGWSLGGVYARMLAQLSPDKVRQVLTLGSPFGGSPMSTALAPVVRSLQATNANPERIRRLRLLAGEALTVPSTAIYSRTDAIVPWRIATQTPSDIAENIEVFTSHTGLGVSPAVLYALADRLAQPDGQWKPFKRIAWKRAVYGPALLSDDRAA
jgi:pimeloyl-ACP methyl ester carboxylesterase